MLNANVMNVIRSIDERKMLFNLEVKTCPYNNKCINENIIVCGVKIQTKV